MRSRVDVRDSYPLSPVQRGILRQTLDGADLAIDLEQVRLVIRGRLRVPEFQQAWHRVVTRHEVLRTGFVWDGVAGPVQLVAPEVPTPEWRVDDLRTIRACQRRRGLAEFLAADRVRGFALDVPPLTRFALLRVSETEHLLVWTVHKLVVDGWSLPILLREVLADYRAAAEDQNVALPTPALFRDHVTWSTSRDLGEAEAFWRAELSGRPGAGPLEADPPDWRGDPAEAFGEHQTELTDDDTARLQETAGQQRIAPNTVLLGCWARLLSTRTGDTDIVVGTTVSGRSPAGRAAEHLVGPLVNTVPVRVRIRPDQPVGVWLRGLQGRQALVGPFGDVPLARVESWAGGPAGPPLFETLIDFETYPMDNDLFTGTPDASALSVRFDGRWSASRHPLTLLVVPGERLGLHARYDLRRLRPATVESLLADLACLLDQVATDPDRPVSALTPPDDKPLPMV